MAHFSRNLVKNSIFYLFVIVLGINSQIGAQTWTPLTNLAPHFSGGVMLLLPDGSVISKSIYGGFGTTPGTTWDKLTPDSTGSYANGTWSTIALMNNDRLYFSSWVMPNGKVYVGGGEYGAGNAAEIYDPIANTWTSLTTPAGVNFSDGVSENLPDGKLLLAAADYAHDIYIFDPLANSYTLVPNTMLPHVEASWLKLPDNSILQVDFAQTSTERYIPSSNTWVTDATVPVQLYDSVEHETGAAMLLPNGQGFFVGATGHTAYYTPSGSSSPGTWTAGPDLPGGYATPDAPMAMMNNGKILMIVSPKSTFAVDFPTPTYFYEFDYTTNTFTAISAPSGADSLNLPTYVSNMLDLPDGTVLYQPIGSKRYYTYTPGGSPLTAGKPAVSNIIRNNCDTFTVAGTLFTGISEGAAYGDDWAMSTNYPIIKISNGSRSWYARSFNWNRPGTVMTGSAADTVQFELPSGLIPGSYSLQVIVNGNPSSTSSFNTTISISPSTASICAGSSTTLAASYGSGTWSSSNAGIAAAGSSSGTVSGVAAGSATITYTLGGCTSTASVTVVALSAITATAGSNGSISPSGVTNVCPGTNEVYSITPNTGYHVSGVTVDGSSLGAVSTYTFSPVTAGSHNISATFAINTYTLTASSGANGSISPTGATVTNYGTSQTYSFTPATGYHVSNVVVDGSSVGAISSYTFTSIAASHTISVSFAINTYTITESSNGYGVNSPAGVSTVNYGSNITYTMTPNTGYYIADVLVDGVSVGVSGLSYTISSVTANHTIYVDYELNTYELDGWSVGGCSISPAGYMILNYGDTQTFTITAYPGNYISNVVVDGVDVGPVSSYTFYTISDFHTVMAYASPDTFVISAASGANGIISPTGTTTLTYGGSQTYTITPNSGYLISNVTVDGSSVGTSGTYTFSSVSANHTISASFAVSSYNITASSGSNGSISPAGTASVSAGGSQTYTMVPSSGYHVNNVTVDGASVGAVTTYTFSSVSANHTISVSFAINTYSITASSGANGTISPSGSTVVSSGGSQTYTMTPATGYHVNAVTVDGASVGAVSSYTFSTVLANHTISVSFAINSYTITASSGANGTISPSGATVVSSGGSQTYTITPASGYHVSTVTVDGTSVGAVTSYTFSTVTANHTINVTFAINTYTITASSGSNGSISPAGTATVSAGGSQTYTLVPSSGYHVNAVTVDGASVGAVTTYTFSAVSANHTISVSFAINTYSITASSGANGTISPTGSTVVSSGGSQIYTMTPASGYHVNTVTVDGASVGTVSSYTFSTVTANHTISVSFAVNTFTITSSAGTNGTNSPSGTTVVSSGGSQTYTMTPASGYHVGTVTVDGTSVGAVSSYTFSTVTANHTISVSFAANTFTITSSAGTNGTISPSGTTVVSSGGSQTYTMTPASGYHVNTVTVDGSSVGAVSSYTFSTVTANHTISVTFAINIYTITASSGSNGSISPAGTATVSAGGSQTYTMVPSSGYHVNTVTVDGASVGAVSTYTFSSVSASHTISVSFAINTYTITASSGANGTISPTGSTVVSSGGSQIYTMTPATGYHINTVTVDGASVGAVSSYTFSTVTANHTISVSFAINTYTIVASAGSHGSISSSGTSTVNYGTNKSYTITPASGYEIDNITVDGVNIAFSVSPGSSYTYTFSSVTANHTISASFIIDFTITASSGPHGSITPSGPSLVDVGDTVTYAITPNTGYAIATLTVDGSSVTPASSYTFYSVSANHTIAATFSAISSSSGHKDSNTGNNDKNNNIPLARLISVYPNPVTGAFNVVIPADYTQASIIVTNLSGRLITTKEVTENQGAPLQFDLSNQASGIYIISVSAGTENFTTKLIKE